MGDKVRFDGGHKNDKFIVNSLGPYFEWVRVCPEVELGLGTPRATLRLEWKGDVVSLVQPKTNLDITDKMSLFSSKRIKSLRKYDLSGYILKSRSPSCGMARVKVYREPGRSPSMGGVGVFAQQLILQNPNLPIEEEGRLCDPELRENWINRVFHYEDFKRNLKVRPTVGKLVKYHTRVKFIVLSHCQPTYREMGRLVANAEKKDIKSIIEEYETLFMTALSKKTTVAKHMNVLEHMLGFFKKKLDKETRAQLKGSLDDYRLGIVPLIVPRTLIRHYATLQCVSYLMEQTYLEPHPRELLL